MLFDNKIKISQVKTNPGHLYRYEMMLSCWSHDPLKRPSFRKLVERTELLLSENTKNVSRWSHEMTGVVIFIFIRE